MFFGLRASQASRIIVSTLAFWQILAAQAATSEESLKAACKSHPQDKNTWYQLGKYQFDQGEFDDSFSSLDTACLLDPAFYPAIQLQAEIAKKLNRYQETRMLARRMIQLDPKNNSGFSLLLDICLSTPQDKNGAAWIVRLAKLKASQDSQLFLQIGKRYTEQYQASKDQYWQKLALESLNECLKIAPNDAGAKEAIAKLH